MKTNPVHRWSKGDVTSALYRNEFIPFFQPKIDLKTGRSRCVEILARWDHPEFGILPPSQFLSLIERAGLIDQFTDNLLRKALINAHECAKLGNEVGIAINFAARTLQDRKTAPRICSMVKEHDVPFEQVTIEVTESKGPENLTAMTKSLMALRSQGFRIAIDDFGIGYSSLSRLSKMPFTELKIDRMFVSSTAKNEKTAGILESIFCLAAKLELDTVAEGIETKEQLDMIRALGCDTGQGFYFGTPMRSFLPSVIPRIISQNGTQTPGKAVSSTSLVSGRQQGYG